MKSSNRKAGTANKAQCIALIGASGSGKGETIKREYLPKLKGPLLVWSPLEETDNYRAVTGGEIVRSIAALVQAVKAGKKKMVYVPSASDVRTEFGYVCEVVWRLEGWTFIVEELSRVTKPSFAHPAWQNLTTAGRHRGLTIIGTSQRPAQIDKDFFANCSHIRAFRLAYPADSKVVSQAIGASQAEITALAPGQFIERDCATGTLTPGNIFF